MTKKIELLTLHRMGDSARNYHSELVEKLSDKIGADALFILVQVLFATTIFLTLSGCNPLKEMVLVERETAIWNSANLTIDTISVNGFPNNHQASLFLDEDSLDEILMGIKGAKITNEKPGEYYQWSAEVDDFSLDLTDGAAFVELSIDVLNADGKQKYSAVVESQITIAGIERDNKNEVLKIKITFTPLKIQPGVSLGWFSLQLPENISGLLADLVTVLGKNQLATYVTVSDRLEVSLIPHQNEPRVNRSWIDEGKNWFVDVKTETKPTSLARYLHLRSPAFVNSGIWFAFDIKKTPQSMFPIIQTTPIGSGKVLVEENKRLLFEIRQLVVEGKLDGDSAKIWIRNSVLMDGAKEIRQLPATHRTAHLQSIRRNGYLSHSDWDHGIIGKGTFYVELATDDAITETAIITDVSASWVADKGPVLKASYAVSSKINLHIHVDPNIGGGTGTTVGILGTSNGAVKGYAEFSLENVGGVSSLLVKPNLECRSLDVKATTDGKLAWDGGWTKVPKIGVTVQQRIGDTFITPSVLASDVPIVIDLEATQSKDVTLNYVNRYSLITTSPKAVDINPQGVFIEIDLNTHFTNDIKKVDAARHLAEVFKENISNYYKGAEKNCPDTSKLLVHVGPLEFGPNNEIVKWATNAWSDITKGLGPGNELVKLKEAADKVIKDAAVEAKRIFDAAIDAAKRGAIGRILSGKLP